MVYDLNYEKLGEIIQKYRKFRGLTQKELANKLDVGLSSVQKYEIGNRKVPISQLISIVYNLSIPFEEISIVFSSTKELKDFKNSYLIMYGENTFNTTPEGLQSTFNNLLFLIGYEFGYNERNYIFLKPSPKLSQDTPLTAVFKTEEKYKVFMEKCINSIKTNIYQVVAENAAEEIKKYNGILEKDDIVDEN